MSAVGARRLTCGTAHLSTHRAQFTSTMRLDGLGERSRTEFRGRFLAIPLLLLGLKWGLPKRIARCSLLEELTSREYWVRNLKEFRCPDCGSLVGYRSRRRTFAERYLLLFLLLQPVRCGDCFRRSYRFLSVQVHDRKELGRKPAAVRMPHSPNRPGHVA